ncbi:hypothetical protein [Frankia tisae]|uniref:hypothetical protein n=2 Tax=Frankia tisae TaxID=2950104 RepID=UPI0021BE2CCF|nr:hypothetical protein [Frankia tisae]
MTDDALLTIRASGPATTGGRLPLAELARIAGEFQATIERIALGLSGLAPAAGPRPKRVVEAVGMEIRALTSGSAVLTVGRIVEPLLGDDLLLGSLEALETGLDAIAHGRPAPEVFTAPVLDGLLKLSGGVADQTLVGVDIHRGGRTTIHFDRELHARVRAARNAVSVAERTIVGRLQMGDFARGSLRCRIDTMTGSITCTFGEELKENVLAAMGSLVRARGPAESTAGGAIRTFTLRAVEQLPGSPHRTLDELAAQQKVRPVRSLAELTLSEPLTDEEYADFLTAAMSARGGQPPQ